MSRTLVPRCILSFMHAFGLASSALLAVRGICGAQGSSCELHTRVARKCSSLLIDFGFLFLLVLTVLLYYTVSSCLDLNTDSDKENSAYIVVITWLQNYSVRTHPFFRIFVQFQEGIFHEKPNGFKIFLKDIIVNKPLNTDIIGIIWVYWGST